MATDEIRSAVAESQERVRLLEERLSRVEASVARIEALLEALGFMHVPSERLFEDAAAILRRAEQRMPAVPSGDGLA